jgi:hypothetical protein
MLRKLNFTERAKLARAAVRIELRRETDGVLAFDPHLDLSNVTAPAHARLFLEAYYRTSYMRFDCGTVGVPATPADRRLSEIDSDNVVRFRLKIVDQSANQHRIVAVADDLVVMLRKPETGSRIPLLPVNFTDLGDLAWRVDFDVSGAVLELNNRIESIESTAKNDVHFFALVYPAAVREILTTIVLIEQHDPHEVSDEWWSLWMRWASRFAEPPVDADDRRGWIEDVVSGFAAQQKLAERFNRRTES